MRKHFFSFLIVMLAGSLLTSSALAQMGRINGTVVDEAGAALEGAMVILEKADANPPKFETPTDSNGRFSMLGLSRGEWTLTVEAEGYHTSLGSVDVTYSRNEPVDTTMARVRHPLVVALGEAAFEGLDPDEVEQDLADADAAFNDLEWQVAIDGYSRILGLLPILNDLHLQVGTAHRELENYDEAIAAYERALVGDPLLKTQIDTEIARTRMAMGDFEAAGSALATAVTGVGASREDLYNLGELEFAKGEIDAASGWYEKAVAADPNWAKPLFKLALVSLNKGDIETAKKFFAQVVEKDPTSEEGAQAQATLGALP